MFSALRQGSIVYILEKDNDKRYKFRKAQVTSVSSPQFTPNSYANGQFGGTLNITINDNGNSRDFGGLPTSENLVRYNNGNVILSESRDVIINEVQSLVANSESILDEDNLAYHKNVIIDGKEILASLNPQFAKEQALDKEVKTLHDRVDGIDTKLDKLITMMSNSVKQ